MLKMKIETYDKLTNLLNRLTTVTYLSKIAHAAIERKLTLNGKLDTWDREMMYLLLDLHEEILKETLDFINDKYFVVSDKS